MRHDLTEPHVIWFLWVQLVWRHELYHPHWVHGFGVCRPLMMEWASTAHKLVLEQLKTVGIGDTLGCEVVHTAQLLSKCFSAGLVVVCLSQWGQLFLSLPARLHCHEQEAGETDFTSLVEEGKNCFWTALYVLKPQQCFVCVGDWRCRKYGHLLHCSFLWIGKGPRF